MSLPLQPIIMVPDKPITSDVDQSVAHEQLCGKTILSYVIDVIRQCSGHAVSIVDTGDDGKMSRSVLTQEGLLASSCEDFLLISGAMPLVTAASISNLYAAHTKYKATVTYVQVVGGAETVLDSDGSDALQIPYLAVVKRDFLQRMLVDGWQYQNEQEAIAHLVARARLHDEPVAACRLPHDQVMVVVSSYDLWKAGQIKRAEIMHAWMMQGVRFGLAQSVHIDAQVVLEPGVFIDSGVHLRGKTVIGKHSHIGAYSDICDATIGEHVVIHPHTIIMQSSVQEHAQVGPFARVHTQSSIAPYAVIGNYVEIKKSQIGAYSKIKHLSYVGDAQVGMRCNVGAGTITCNYDGREKHSTIIEDGVFIGSNNTLIAPVHIAQGAYTAAGSTITDDVPAHALALARARQVVKAHYAPKLRKFSKSEQP